MVLQVIAEKKWDNGLSLLVHDCSRCLAADRWHIKVVGTLRLKVLPEFFENANDGNSELDFKTRDRIGDCLEHQLVRERNFIDAAIKDELVESLAEQLIELLSRYQADHGFARRLFESKYREIRDLCAMEMAREEIVDSDDNEPADFSHCFR